MHGKMIVKQNCLNFSSNKWKDQSKKIISIGSSVASYNPSGSGYNDYVDL